MKEKENIVQAINGNIPTSVIKEEDLTQARERQRDTIRDFIFQDSD